MEFKHRSVLLEETVSYLNVRPEGTYVDGTLGGGGHAEAVLRKLNDQGRLIGIDQDAAAMEAAGERLKAFSNAILVRSNYCNIRNELDRLYPFYAADDHQGQKYRQNRTGYNVFDTK